MLDPVEFGKAMASIVREATGPLLKRIEQLEARQPEKGDPGIKGDPGKDAPPVTDEQIAEHVAKYLKTNPPPRGEKGDPGKSVALEDIAPLIAGQVRAAVDSIPKPQDGKSVTVDEVSPLIERKVKEAVDSIPKPRDGKDAQPISVRDAVRQLLESDELLSLVELRVKEEISNTGVDAKLVKGLVAEAVAQIPAPKDGRDATDEMVERVVTKHLREHPPKKGADGVGLAGALIDRDGNLVVTLSNGEVKTLGCVVGEKGKDGADFTEVRFEYDGERTLKAIGKGGEIVYRLPIPIDRGYWRAGQYEKGDIATEGGSAYIAIKDTAEKPSLSSGDWRILARKGRDGKDGRNGIDKTAPVKIDA